MLGKLKEVFLNEFLLLHFWLKRLLHKQLYIFISTPYYGNVGDHGIELAQRQIMKEALLSHQMFEINAIEYADLNGVLKKIVRRRDVIILDGGGNLGDTWKDTIESWINILQTYKDNPILIFPESWYFSDSEYGRIKQKELISAVEEVKNIIIFARDYWSYNSMTKCLNDKRLKYSYDMVLLWPIHENNVRIKYNYGVALRNDKENIKDEKEYNALMEYLNTSNCKYHMIENDCYKHISKWQRKKYVEKIMRQYRECNLIITDRFHGLIFAILLKKACIVLDNKTGKIYNFYNDICKNIQGIWFCQSLKEVQKLLDSGVEGIKLIVDEEFQNNISTYRAELIKALQEMRSVQ